MQTILPLLVPTDMIVLCFSVIKREIHPLLILPTNNVGQKGRKENKSEFFPCIQY